MMCSGVKGVLGMVMGRLLINIYSKGFWLAVFTVAFLLICVGSLFYYPGSALVLLFFQLVFLLMFMLAWTRPFVDSYFFLALFLFMGFCLKFNVHLFVEYPFVEPVGNFDGTPGSWDRALAGAAVAALGIVVFRVLQLSRYYFSPPVRLATAKSVPSWYLEFPGTIWTILILFSITLYVANYFFAFYQTGVNSSLALPFGLGAVLAWLCYGGVIIVLYLILDWEFGRRSDRTWPIIGSVCLFGILVSVSLLSRATMILLFLSFSVVLVFHKKHLLFQLWSTWGWKISIFPVVSLFVSLVLVSWLRMNTYDYGLSRAEATGMTPTLMFIEVMRLGVDRWIGLEGMLVFSASDAHGLSVLKSLLGESPRAGINSIYQGLSNSPYKFMDDFTYLTLPGAPALLFSSGSLTVVFGGMFLLTAILNFFERFTLWASQSRFVTAWVGVLMANAVCQMNFPYLWGVFVVVTFSGLSTLAFVIKRGAR